MKVILTQDVAGTGRAGEVREVADGFARNYLLPQRMAQPAQPKAEAQIRAQKDRQRHRVEAEVVAARELAARLGSAQVEITARAGDTGKLYGAVVNIDVAEALESQLGTVIDRRKIEFEPAHELGEYEAVVKIHAEVEARVRVRVVAA
ncbi:MAG TPA: 50S ribosomal protein L9 [Candidatus Nanopelagicaceae bacterium]|nr:50S ribosomal protein L9 [Candidatus Nanopelagicaceae bacterium]